MFMPWSLEQRLVVARGVPFLFGAREGGGRRNSLLGHTTNREAVVLIVAIRGTDAGAMEAQIVGAIAVVRTPRPVVTEAIRIVTRSSVEVAGKEKVRAVLIANFLR